MSRIEQALEKAAQKRGQQAPAQSPPPRQERPLILTEPVMKRAEAPPETNHENPLLVMINDAASPIAEEYRKLKAVVSQLTKSDSFQNTLLVTSAIPNEGKSVTALNLAVCLAQELDHTVLLVDADLRRPSVHRYLDLENGPGLTQCLAQGEDIATAIVPTAIDKLSVVRAGNSTENPVELFSSQRMRDLVQELKTRYHDRYVIFDSPPVLPFAEARTLAQLVDGVIMVVKEGYTPLTNIQDAISSLAGTNMLGIVYNDAEIVKFDERYKYYHNYYYQKQGNRAA